MGLQLVVEKEAERETGLISGGKEGDSEGDGEVLTGVASPLAEQ